MPIDADRFESIDDEEAIPSPGTNAYEILSFLTANAEMAFTQTEVAEATGVTRGSVGPTLVRLRDAGRVDHRGTYWRISDHVRSLDAAASLAGDVAESYEGTSFDHEEWRKHSVDPRESRE